LGLIFLIFAIGNFCYWYNFLGGKLQITPLKFGSDWILQSKVSKFRFYSLKFDDVWILHPNVSKFGFYPLYFKSLGYLDFTP